MTYGQRERAAARKLAKVMAEAKARYDALPQAEKDRLEALKRSLREKLLGSPLPR